MAYSGQPVVAAQAVASGQVVVALADGGVDLLQPQGNALSVESILQTQGAGPASPSAIDVVNKPGGQLNVLVSSEGSDNIYVFSQVAVSEGGGGPLPGGATPPELNLVQTPTLSSATTTSSTLALSTTAITTSASATATTSTSASTSSASVSSTATTSVGLSLGNFSSLGNRSTTGNGGTVLVAVEGNTYVSVPILDFGSAIEADEGAGKQRMPWLSRMHNFGDSSPLTKFVIGLDEALRAYRGADDPTSSGGRGLLNDPWNEDLFHQHLRVIPPENGRAHDEPHSMRPDGQLQPPVGAGFQDPTGALPERPPARKTPDEKTGFVALGGLIIACIRTWLTRGSPSRQRGRSAGVIAANRRFQRLMQIDFTFSRAQAMTSASPGAVPVAGEPWVRVTGSPRLWNWLAEERVSLAFTTYQTGKLFLLGRHPEGRLAVFERTFNRAMGLCADGQTLWLSTLYQLWRFENLLRPGELYQGHDRLYVPKIANTTGDLDIHDIAIDHAGRPLFIATGFGCIATLSERSSFTPLWRPPFLGRQAAEDRCHLNGLAMADGRPRFVTAVSTSDVVDGWRDRRHDGGVVLDVPEGRVIASGLSMPHSPRLYRDRLWLHNSGTGYFGSVDPGGGPFEPLTFCPGYLRGLAFVGDHAVVGLSHPRHDQTFSGLALEGELARRNAEPRCGLLMIDLRTGDVAHWLRVDGLVRELYDVAVLPDVSRPMALGFKSDEIARTVAIGDQGSL